MLGSLQTPQAGVHTDTAAQEFVILAAVLLRHVPRYCRG